MIKLSTAYFYLYCLLVVSSFFAPTLFKPFDELVLLMMLALGFVDVLYNKSWKKYKTFFVAAGILFFYYIYTLGFCHYNIFKAVTMDFWTQLKPVIAFSVAYAIAPQFSKWQITVVKFLFVAIGFVGLCFYYTPYFYDVLQHEYYLGAIFLCGVVVFLMLMDGDDKAERRNDLFWIMVMILMGLACSRSKYYVSVVLLLFLIFIYKPRIVTTISMKNMAVMAVLLFMAALVGWGKFDFYFISGSGIVDEVLSSADSEYDLGMMAARPVLYYGFVQVLADHFWLGSGLASFATVCSSTLYNYSSLYYDYGINVVWGLSEDFDSFMADTFYPELAQFGVVGIALFVALFVWFGKRLKIVHRECGIFMFVSGMSVLLLIIVDSVAACGALNTFGENLFAVLGMVLAKVKHIEGRQAVNILKTPLAGRYSVWKNVGLKIRRY